MTARLTVGAVAWAGVIVIVAVLAAFGAGGQSARAGEVGLTPTVTSTSTPTSTSTATATAVPTLTPTPTSSPTPTPQPAEAPAGLPPTGSEPPIGSFGFPQTLAAALVLGGLAALVAGGVVLWKRAR